MIKDVPVRFLPWTSSHQEADIAKEQAGSRGAGQHSQRGELFGAQRFWSQSKADHLERAGRIRLCLPPIRF